MAYAGSVKRIDWVFFGDDWGRHPSTTQHLTRALLARSAAVEDGGGEPDRFAWVDSFGARTPELTARDVRRVVERVGRVVRGLAERQRATTSGQAAPFPRLAPVVAPWHHVGLVQAANRTMLRGPMARLLREAGIAGGVAVLGHPVAGAYVDLAAPRKLVYLRLDDFAALPGVDPRMVHATEPGLIARADLVVAPSARLVPSAARRTLILPQGVDLDAFAAVPAEPPGTRVLGYWGMLSRWLDQDLVMAVARARPAWTFELRGPVDTDVSRLLALSNVRLLPPVPHARLAEAAAHWQAAWMPFRVDGMAGLSPLKLREYLAAGLMTAATALPEVDGLEVTVVSATYEVLAFLAAAERDDAAARAARRRSQAGQGWAARAEALRAAVLAL